MQERERRDRSGRVEEWRENDAKEEEEEERRKRRRGG